MRKAVTTAIAAILVPTAGGAVQANGPARPLDPRFVALHEITTPIFGESRIEGALSATLVIQASNPKAAAALRGRMPEIRAEALATTIEFSRLYASGMLPVDAQRLSADLNSALKKSFPGIERVLIVRVGAVPA